MHRIIYPGIPIAAFMLGVSYLVFSSIYELQWLNHLFTELSNAAIVLGLLGLTLEPSLRRAFARDVFRAAFGYHLPEDFKDQIARIASHRVICTKHIMDVRIRTIDKDSVRVTLLVERHFQNIGASPVFQRAMTWIDEWRFSEPSEITRCEIFNEKGTRSHTFKPDKIDYKPNLSMQTQSPRMVLLRNWRANTVLEYSIIRRRNDQFIEIFMTPTREPEIRIIEKPEGFEVFAGFGGDDKLRLTHIPDRYVLNGVYFPPAIMKIRWFSKADLENWPPTSFVQKSQ